VKKLWGTLALGLVLFATLFSYEVNAAGTSTCTGAGGQSQLGQYCGSAQSSQEGSNSNSALWKVWGGVSAVCISACVSANPAGAETCNISSQGGAATEGVVTKNYSSSLTSIAQSQGSSQLAKIGSSSSDDSDADNGERTQAQQDAADKKAANAKAKKAKAAACSGAIVAAGKAMSDYRGMQSSTQAADQTSGAAASLGSSAQETVGGSGAGLSSSRGAVSGSGKEGTSAATSGGIASICASARQTSNVGETLQCAIGSDSSLPSIVTSGQLPKAFTKATGQDFSNFGNNSDQSPADAIAQAAIGSMSTSDGLKVAALLKGMEGDFMNGAFYASGGGDAKHGDEPESAAAQAQLQDQLKEMLAKSQGDNQAAPSGVSAVILANQNRAPAAVTEDRTLSIFDRVTYRYYFVVRQSRVENFQ
jgi:hypothetical protein